MVVDSEPEGRVYAGKAEPPTGPPPIRRCSHPLGVHPILLDTPGIDCVIEELTITLIATPMLWAQIFRMKRQERFRVLSLGKPSKLSNVGTYIGIAGLLVHLFEQQVPTHQQKVKFRFARFLPGHPGPFHSRLPRRGWFQHAQSGRLAAYLSPQGLPPDLGCDEQEHRRAGLIEVPGIPTRLIFLECCPELRFYQQAGGAARVVTCHVRGATIVKGHLGLHPGDRFDTKAVFLEQLVQRAHAPPDLFRMYARASVAASSTLLVSLGTR